MSSKVTIDPAENAVEAVVLHNKAPELKRDAVVQCVTSHHPELVEHSERINELDCIVLQNCKTPTKLAIFLHGFGMNNTEVVPHIRAMYANYLAASRVAIRFVIPDGVLTFEHQPSRKAWWNLDFNRILQLLFAGMLTKDVPQGLPEARKAIIGLVEELSKSTQIPISKIAIGGVSQGAMLATDVALHLETAPAVLCCMSGMLVAENIWREKAKQKKGLKVMQCHGTNDSVIPFFLARLLENVFRENQLELDFIEFKGGHEVPPQSVFSKLARILVEL